MNKRMKKKQIWLGTKRAGANYCANEIFRHILRKMAASGIPMKPCYIRNTKSYVSWFFHHSSEKEWDERVEEAYVPYQMILSAKQLLVDHRNAQMMDMLNELAEERKAVKEKLLSGDNDNLNIGDPHSMDYRIRSYGEYGATGIPPHQQYMTGKLVDINTIESYKSDTDNNE